ncbi:hypothetical protein GCM10028786_26190 [Flaviaesturariibacter terrae]
MLLLLLLLPALLRAQEPDATGHDSLLHALQRPYNPGLKPVWGADSTRGGYSFRELRYAVDGDTATALFVRPSRQPFPLLLFQHWGGGNRRSFLAEAAHFAEAGYGCLLLDAPWLWPTADTSANPVAVYPDNILRSCRAVISFLDFAEKQSYVDPQRVYYIGHSYGATLGGLLLAAEPRIRAAVFMAGLPSLSLSMREDPLGQWKATRARFPGIFDSAVQRLARMEPEDLVHRSDAPVLYQAANKDQYVTRAYSERYISAVHPLQTGWYDTDHLFASSVAAQDRFAFIRAQDSIARHTLKVAQRLMLEEAKRSNTADARPWQRQEWRGRSEVYLNGDTIGLRQRWRFQFPDSAYIETVRADSGSGSDRRWMLVTTNGGKRSAPGGGEQPLDAATWYEERQLFFLYWAAHMAPMGQGQLHLVRGTKGGPVVEWILRPFRPVRFEFSDSTGRLVALTTQVASGRSFRLEPSDYRGIRGARRPYVYTLTRNGSPYFRAIVHEIRVY